MNFGIDDALRADKLIRPPYYDPFSTLLRRVGRALGVIVRFGRNGVYIIQRPSDETMNRLDNAKSA